MLSDTADPTDLARLEAMAAQLAASGHFRVLRRIAPRPSVTPPAGAPTRLGLLLDLETTGLDPIQDEIIEMAMLPFTCGLDGSVYAVSEPFSRLRPSPRNPFHLQS